MCYPPLILVVGRGGGSVGGSDSGGEGSDGDGGCIPTPTN